MRRKGILIIISGFSGAGKGTLVKRLVEKYDGYALSISATTREPRPGEKDGREYFFLSKEQFEHKIEENGLIEYARYCDNYYGTPREYVEKQLENGRDVILEIEIQGALAIRERFPDKKLILSESCLEFGKYEKEDGCVNAGRLAHDMIGNLNHGMNGFYDWNVLLDETGGPNHVNNLCDAPFLYDRKSGELKERYILAYYRHFARFIKPGAVRIGSSCYTSELEVTAWKNPDSTIVFLVLNRTEHSHTYTLRLQGEMITDTARPYSITSSVITEQ